MQTTREFIRKQHIRMDAPKLVDRNPNMDEDNWARSANHFKVTFRKGQRQMTTYYSMGAALSREPTEEEVLSCLASDATTPDDGFEEWAREFGYDPDSRKAERVYKACKRQTEKLRGFLGQPAFEELVYETERE
jgi:hypothetical protein